MRKTTIVNLRDKPDLPYVRVDRLTEWGNPFPISPVQDRHAVIERYRAWLMARIESDPQALSELREMAGERLACWCSPEPCHADVLAAVADRLAEYDLTRQAGEEGRHDAKERHNGRQND